jgi:hypothetical protein
MPTVTNTVGYSDAAATIQGDYATIADWLAARKTATRASGDIEELVLLDYSAASNTAHDVSGTNWGGWYAGAGDTTVIVKPQNTHGGSWGGTAITNTSSTFGSNTIYGGAQTFSIEFQDLVIDLDGRNQPILRLGNDNASNTNPFSITARRCLIVPGNNGAFQDNTNNVNQITPPTQTYTYENCVISSKGTTTKPLWAASPSGTSRCHG